MSSMHLLPTNLFNQTVYLNPNMSVNMSVNSTNQSILLNETIASNRGYEPSMALINFDETALEPEKEDSFALGSSISLYNQFFEAIQKYGTNDDNIFEMLSEFELLCCDHLTVTSNLIKSKVRNTVESQNMNKLENLLRLERNSWRLFKSIFEDKKSFSSMDTMEDMIVDDITSKMSDKKLIERSFEKNSELRQMQVVIDWLERNQMDDNEDMGTDKSDKVQFYSEGIIHFHLNYRQFNNF